MPYRLTDEIALAERFLALAEFWRDRAAQTDEAWRSYMMNATANEYEKAAAEAASHGAPRETRRLRSPLRILG
jgi:hypothetical protein